VQPSVQGKAGTHVNTSPFEVDVLHMQFWRECIDASVPPLTFAHVVSFVPPSVEEAITSRASNLAQTVARRN
jgi:hypothetical protein